MINNSRIAWPTKIVMQFLVSLTIDFRMFNIFQKKKGVDDFEIPHKHAHRMQFSHKSIFFEINNILHHNKGWGWPRQIKYIICTRRLLTGGVPGREQGGLYLDSPLPSFR